MKAALCFVSLAILAGVMAAPFAWDPDTIYSYRVQSRFAAGMLGLDGPAVDDTETDRAFVELTWEVDIYQHQPNQIFMNPRNFRAIITKEKIHPRDEQISSLKETAIPQKYVNLLEKVMIVKLDPRSGVPDSIVVRGEQPLSTIEKNIKRAQVQAFILNPGTSKLVVKGNVNRQTNSVRPSEQDDDSGFFYKVMEETIHGECQTYYQVSQTGPLQSLYQLEAQDVPVPAQDENNDDSNDQQEQSRNPRFAGFQRQQWQKQQMQQQQWQTRQQQQQWQTRQQQNQWQAQHQSESENEINQDAQQQPWPQAFKQFCDENDQIYTIQKTVNLTACKDRPVLSNMMPAELLNCRPGDNSCGSLWNHVVNTRFVACGQNRNDFTIIEVNQEERFVYGLRTDETLDGFAVKNVTLQEKERTSSNPAAAEMKKQGQNEYVIKSLVFEFDLNDQLNQLGGQPQQQWQQHQQWQHQQQQHQWQQSSSHDPQNQQDSDSDSDSSENNVQGTNGRIRFPLQSQQPGLETPPLRPTLISPVVSPQQLQNHAQKLVQDCARNIHDPTKSVPEGETLALQSVLAKTLRYMSTQEQLELYENAVVKSNQNNQELQLTIENILVDAMAASGTNPSLVTLMKLIEEENINDYKASQLVMTFAHYARHPTKQFLQRFAQFIESKPVQNSPDLRATAILAFGTLLHNACVNARTKQSSFSYSLYGPFCQPEDVEEYVDQSTKQLQEVLEKKNKKFQKRGQISEDHEISLQLAFLRNIGHPKLIKVVQRILDESNRVQLKSDAIYALRPLIRSHDEVNPVQDSNGNVDTEQNQNEVDRVESDPITDEFVEKKVLPLLMSVGLDKSEHPNVRMAALQMLFYCSHADMTVWQQVAMSTWFSVSQEVHNFIYTTIRNLADLEVAPTRVHMKMMIKARSVFPLLKPLDDENAGKSTNTFASGNAQHLNSQYFRQLSWIGSRDSVFPTSVYLRNFLSFGSGGAGVNPIEVALHMRTIRRVIEKVQDKFTGSSSSEESGENNEYLKKILQNIDTREMKENPHGSLYINIRNGIQRLWQIDNLEKLVDFKNHPFITALRRGVSFNYQKTIQLAHQSMEFPTILGLPMNFKLRVPAMVSFRGRAKLNAARNNPQFQAEIDAVIGYKRHAKVSLKIPYIQRKIESGVQSHFVVQTPFRFTARSRSDEPIIFAITPTVKINGSACGKIELATFHRKPYVAVITDELHPTVLTEGGPMTLIRTLDQPTVTEKHMENVLGFSVSTEETSDYRPEKETQEGWARYFSNFPDVETFAHLGSFGGPVAKYAHRKLYLNVDESQSKTLIGLLAGKRESGPITDGFDTDISSSSSSSSSTSESDDSDSSDSSSEETNSGQDRQNDQNEQSSSSSEFNEDCVSDENSTVVARKSRVIVLAVLAKTEEVPPVSRLGSLLNLLKPEYANQRQFILQLSKRTDTLFLRYAQGAAAEEAARNLPTESKSIQMLARAVIEPDYQGQQNEFCSRLSGKIQYPKFAHPRLLVALRETLLNNELSVQVQVLAQFAHTCKNDDLKQNQISMTGQLQRGQNMTEWAKAKSPEAQQCKEDEDQGFSVSDDCLTVSNEQASALNRGRFNIQWTDNMPEPFQQAVYDARDMVKAAYQAHVYHDRFPENLANGNSAVVSLQISPDGEYWSANVLTNETELTIQNVPSNEYIQAAFPPSAIQSVAQNIQDYVYGNDAQPTCQLEGKFISSFDNVVGEIDTKVADGCYHLLTADGSGKDTMAVLAKNIGTDNMKLQLILSQTKITLTSQRSVPRARLAQVEQANDISVVVNGQPVNIPYIARKPSRNPDSNDYYAHIQTHPSGGVQILTPTNDIAFDGTKVIIWADNKYRNVTVGMCGDFDGERVADRRSRKDIPLSSPTLLYANYAYDAEGNQCNVQQQVQQQIKLEESLAKMRRGSGNSPSNIHWANAQSNRRQQRNAWQNRPTQSSSSYEDSSYSYSPSSQSRQNNRNNQQNRH